MILITPLLTDNPPNPATNCLPPLTPAQGTLPHRGRQELAYTASERTHELLADEGGVPLAGPHAGKHVGAAHAKVREHADRLDAAVRSARQRFGARLLYLCRVLRFRRVAGD